MEDKNLKLKLKSELKNKMPKRIYIELLDDMGIDQELGKNQAVDLIFEKYSANQVKDLILKKYNKNNLSRKKEEFLNTLNRISIDERSRSNKKDEREKKRKLHQKRIERNKKKQKKREKELEEARRKEKELEEKLRKIEEERREEAKRIQEQKKRIEEEKRIKEERIKEIHRKREEEKKRKARAEKEKEREKKSKKDRIENKKKELKKQNKLSNLKIYHTEETDICFIYDYIKSQIRKDYKKDNIRLSSKVKDIVKIDEKLIDYKYENKNVDYFTEKLLKAIENIYEIYFEDKDGIALLAVPPSEMGKDPQTKQSIDLIEEWCNEEKIVIDFRILNESKTLKRIKTVESSKEGNRSVEKHENSIEFDREEKMPSNMGLIILDDITTSGNTMYACKKILIKSGLDEDDIIPLAIARTLNPYTEIYDSISEGKYLVYDEEVEELDE